MAVWPGHGGCMIWWCGLVMRCVRYVDKVQQTVLMQYMNTLCTVINRCPIVLVCLSISMCFVSLVSRDVFCCPGRLQRSGDL